MPLLSIVIANYNYGRFLEAAIRSIVKQIGVDGVGKDDVELIVVDGGSTDNSISVIKRFSKWIAWWVSEKDRGQSDAFNKGFARARGKYLTWLNADDVLMPGSLSRVLKAMRCHPECAWFTGNFCRFTEDGKIMAVGWGPHFYPMFLQRPNSPIVTFGPSSFFSKAIFERVGGFDVSLHYVMDVDLWLRFMAARIFQRRINCLCWGFRMHEGSKTAEFGEHRLDDKRSLALKSEMARVHLKTKYRMSRALRMVLLVLRIADFSIVRSLLLNRFKGQMPKEAIW